MGTSPESGIGDALFTSVQQRVLSLLFGQPERRFQSAELIRLASGGTGAVHRQLSRLAKSGLITMTQIGNQKHYQANASSPIFAELHGLVLKTVALVEPLQAALAPLASRIHAAFVYGSVASRTDRATSDIDLMVLSDALSYADVFEALQPTEQLLARSVNPTLMTTAQWRTKRAEPDSFASRIVSADRLFIIGGASDVD